MKREGRGGYWEVHHKVRQDWGGSDALKNLVTLCKPCHKKETMKAKHANSQFRRFWRIFDSGNGREIKA